MQESNLHCLVRGGRPTPGRTGRSVARQESGFQLETSSLHHSGLTAASFRCSATRTGLRGRTRLLAISSIFKEQFGARLTRPMPLGDSCTQRLRKPNPVCGRGPPVYRRVVPSAGAIGALARNTKKSRLQVETALERSQTSVGRVYSLESASLERKSKRIACATSMCHAARGIDRATCPSFNR